MTLYPVPKPEPKIKEPKGLKQRGRSRFPEQRNEAYKADVLARYQCILYGLFTLKPITIYDIVRPDTDFSALRFEHRCGEPLTPMHVFKTQACGAGDVGEIVVGCWPTHIKYDQDWTRAEFARYTGISQGMLQVRAVKIANELGWKKLSGVWVSQAPGDSEK